MKLSFSTRGWETGAWEEWIAAAEDMHFSGVEVYNAHKDESLFDKGGPFHKYSVASTVRSLNESRMAIPCLDSSIDLSGDVTASVEALKSLMNTAADMRVPYVGAYAAGDNEDNVRAAIDSLLPFAAEKRVAILVKTTGIYSDTARLSQLMNHFACDEIGVIWDMHHTVREGKESAAQTIKNLGAYVRHVHLRDSDSNGEYCPIGEGSLPVNDLMDALGSINYDGYISLVWKLEWSEEINVAGCVYLAEACREIGAKLVMCSSDQVYFGGGCPGPHKETETLCPGTVYGSQKLRAERQVLAILPDAVCLRLSWMYARESFPGEHGHFFATLTAALENEDLPLSWPVYDRRGLTDVKYVVENMEKALSLPGGAWNFGSGNDQSTFDTVKSVLEELGLEKGLARLTPNAEAFAANPRDITMDQTKLRQAGILFPTTTEGLRRGLTEWKQERDHDKSKE